MRENKSLPAFTCLSADAVDLWPAASAGMPYGEQNTLGRERAEDLLDVIRRTGSPVLLGHVLEAMVKKGKFEGVEIGFCHALSVDMMLNKEVRQFVEVQKRHAVHDAQARLGHLTLVSSAAAA